MLKSFIDANVGKQVRLVTRECECDCLCTSGTPHYVKGLFLGLRYYKRFRCLGIEISPPPQGQVVLVRLKNVIRVEPLVNTHGEDSDGGRRTEGTDSGSV